MQSRSVWASLLLAGAVLSLTACGSDAQDTSASAVPSLSAAASPLPSASPAAAGSANASAARSFDDAVAQYRTYVVKECDLFVQESGRFVQAVKDGDLQNAKKLYAPARMHYERIEPIAEALGDLDPNLDARENDVDAADWRGFHKLEKALWQDGSTSGMAEVADRLLNDAKMLRALVETVQIEPGMMVTGAVELLNEVSSSKVTGEEERYSRTDLYDFAANVEGAERIYTLLKPHLAEKDPALEASIADRFKELENTLSPYRQGEGYVLYDQLKPEQVKALSQTIDALAEPLSHMGTLLGV